MQSRTFRRGSLLLTTSLIAGCGTAAKLTIPQTTGPNPTLAAPTHIADPNHQCRRRQGLARSRRHASGQHRDERVTPPRPDLVAKAITPDYALGPHTASLGLASADARTVRDGFGPGMLGVAIDAEGALLVADDVGNAVWRVSRAPGS
jgi:hypothetical protein